jgi:hypothetical protein
VIHRENSENNTNGNGHRKFKSPKTGEHLYSRKSVELWLVHCQGKQLTVREDSFCNTVLHTCFVTHINKFVFHPINSEVIGVF